MTGDPETTCDIMVDGCTLFNQIIEGRCHRHVRSRRHKQLASPDIEIALLSDTHNPETRDRRTLGVGVDAAVELRGGSPRDP